MASNYDECLYSSSSCSDSEYNSEHLEDLSYAALQTIPECSLQRNSSIHSLQLDNNEISSLPSNISVFKKLITLDISSNNMTFICDEICSLPKLRTLIAKNNKLNASSFPKEFGTMQSLEVLNVSGNLLASFPAQFTKLEKLQVLHFGCNRLKELPITLKQLTKLEVLYLGGNELTEVPAELGCLSELKSLILCDNLLVSLPPTLIHLGKLRSLSLHNNRLSTLPTEIVALNLVELSLRNNPLVNRFVQDLVYNPPSLLELAGRSVKLEKVPYTREDLPANLLQYLESALSCVNPKCKGVYFTSRFEHVKFVDFCGKYRLPLLQYLCSPKCSSTSSSCDSCDSESEEDVAREKSAESCWAEQNTTIFLMFLWGEI